MNRRCVILIGLALISLLAFGYWRTPTNFSQTEAIFEGRPTSYWRGVVIEWLEIDLDPCPTLTFWDKAARRIGLHSQQDQLKLLDILVRLANTTDADAVLRELSCDSNSKVADFAKEISTTAIRHDQEIEERNRQLLVRLLWKYHIQR